MCVYIYIYKHFLAGSILIGTGKGGRGEGGVKGEHNIEEWATRNLCVCITDANIQLPKVSSRLAVLNFIARSLERPHGDFPQRALHCRSVRLRALPTRESGRFPGPQCLSKK